MKISADALYAAMAHPLRLRALLLLQQEAELCVCELTHALRVSQPMISRHLAQLRQAGLVGDRRQGLWVYYRLHEALPGWVRGVLTATAEGVGPGLPYTKDRARLVSMSERPGSACGA